MINNLQRVAVDLCSPGVQPHVYAAAGDRYSRYLQLDLYSGGQPYEPPEGTTCVIGWRRGSAVGSYDKVALENGDSRQAWQLEGSTLTIELDWHITEAAGPVSLNVGLLDADGGRLSTWELVCDVHTGAVKDADNPELPSESATQAANRAEAAAGQAQQALKQMGTQLADATTQAVKDATAQAESAAEQAEQALEQMDSHLADAASQAVKDATAQAESAAARADQALQAANGAAVQADNAAGRAESIADQLDQVLKDGPVVSVNGKTGRVMLSGGDVPFDNIGTPLTSTTVQDAIEELLSIGGGGGVSISTVIVTAPAGSTVVLERGAKRYTQTVDSAGTPLTFQVLETGAWTVTSTLGDLQDSRTINVVQAGDTYSVSLDYNPFKAYLQVTVIGAPDGAMVKASMDGTEVSGAAVDGEVTLQVGKEGNWTITATYADGIAQPAQVDVQDQGDDPTYQVSVRFCTLTVTAPAGSSVEIKNGGTTLTGTADSGSVKFWLPHTGTWTTKATLDGQTANGSVACTAYQDYTTELTYFSAAIKVTAVQGAHVTAVLDGYTVSGDAGSDGSVTLTVARPGSYTVKATYSGADSNSKTVQVSQSGQQYTASVEFITLTVTAPEGSSIAVKNGATTLTATGGTVKFWLPRTGTWTATAELNGQTANSSVDCSAYQSYSVELAYIQRVLANNPWSTIMNVADADEGANWWAIGDTKPVPLNGRVGNLTLSNLTVDAFILGFNHNAAKEGAHLIHFALGKISGKMVALCDSQYDNYTSSGYFVMNGNGSNSGGWNASEMRKNTLGNSGTPSSPPANSLLAALPAELRAVLKPVTKYTDNTGNSSNSSGAVTATIDYLWLLAEFEVFASRSYANQYEKNSQMQYDYFKAGNSKVAYKHNSTSSAVWVWLRSSPYSSSTNFCALWSDGSPYGTLAYRSGGVLAGFAV